MTYQIIAVTGSDGRKQGGVWKAEFGTFEKAQEYRDENNNIGNLHIKMLDRSWWPEDYKP